LFDTLRFAPRPDNAIELRCAPAVRSGGPLLPADETNLVFRAARLLASETGCRRGASITLLKRIPLASGLGGGSSDAAAALAALNRLWETGLSSADLHALAACLGSDVNFFLDSHPLALCRGRGEVIEPRPLGTPLHFVLARPRSGLSTAAVFRAWQDDGVRAGADRLLQHLAEGRVRAAGHALHNSLEAPAVRLNDDVRRVLADLARVAPRACRMTGSGAVCYGLCASRRQARSLGARLRGAVPGLVWIVSSAV
jgi:4-diphosphocytidyl-2-C-methyl-D-erythritol kinase